MFVFQTNLVSEFLPIENYRGKACKEKKMGTRFESTLGNPSLCYCKRTPVSLTENHGEMNS